MNIDWAETQGLGASEKKNYVLYSFIFSDAPSPCGLKRVKNTYEPCYLMKKHGYGTLAWRHHQVTDAIHYA